MKEIQLTQGKVALVDDADFDYLNQWKWYAQNTKAGFYAARKDEKDKCILMHRLLLGITEKKTKGDHIDRNSLNNQRCNLRQATHSQNMANRKKCEWSSSKYLGVSWCNRDSIWIASITKDNKKICAGRFRLETDAAVAYNKKSIELHGEFANLNLL